MNYKLVNTGNLDYFVIIIKLRTPVRFFLTDVRTQIKLLTVILFSCSYKSPKRTRKKSSLKQKYPFTRARTFNRGPIVNKNPP